MDTKPITVNAVEEMEETKEVAASDDKIRLQAKRSTQDVVRMNKWQSVNRKEVRFVMNLQWFRKQGLFFLQDFTLATLGPKTSC